MNSKACLVGVVACSVCCMVFAEERVYSIIDAQGRVQIIKGAEEKPATPTQTPSSSAATQSTKPPNAAFQPLDDEIYVDSEYLEQKSFNLEDKKRFYYVPNGTSSQPIIESNANSGGVSVPIAEATNAKRREAFYADDYQTLSKEWLIEQAPATQQLCQQAKKLKKAAQPFKDSNALWLTADSDATRFDRVLAFSAKIQTERALRITSFASSNKNPTFYVPVVSFLDAQGCVLSGAWQYWSRAYPANEHHFSAVEGLLRVPSAAQYVAFLSPVKGLDSRLPQKTTGSLLIENE